MSKLSDIIECFIKDMFETADEDTIVIQRNMLAQQFDCSPSQINYVLTTRFNNNRGYIVESRRGGGGYVRIFRIDKSKYDDLETMINKTIGDSITLNKACDIIDVLAEREVISDREKNIMKRALCDRTLCNVGIDERNRLRACILKEMMLAVAGQ